MGCFNGLASSTPSIELAGETKATGADVRGTVMSDASGLSSFLILGVTMMSESNVLQYVVSVSRLLDVGRSKLSRRSMSQCMRYELLAEYSE